MKSINVLAGFAETDITPAEPDRCELIGFNRPDSNAKGVLHPLKSQALIFQSDNHTCCIITVDSIGITTELTNQLRDTVASNLSISRENVMVCYSHTHAAPDAAAHNAEYFKYMVPKILEAVKMAFDTMFPMKAAWGIAENTIGINRRKGAAVMDNRIGVLKISNAITNKTEILLLRVTAHANVLTGDNYYISSDYFGVTRTLLEKEYGCKVLMTQGASGNIRSKFRQRNADMLEESPFEAAKIKLSEAERRKIFNESISALQKNADEIKKSILAVFDNLKPNEIYRLKMFSSVKTFIADVPSIERASEIVSEAEKEAGIDGENWFNKVAWLNATGVRYQTATKEIQFFALNNGCLCGVADEPMCEISLDIQHKAQDDMIFFGGYTNGYEGYLPNGEEYDKGGYEVLWSNLIYYIHYNRVMPLNRDTADKLSSFIVHTWKTILAENKVKTVD